MSLFDKYTTVKLPGVIPHLEKRLGASHGNGNELQFFCPFCEARLGTESNERKLWVNQKTGASFCYRCEFRAKSWEPLFKSLSGGFLRPDDLMALRKEVTPPEKNLSATVRRMMNDPLAKAASGDALEPVRLPECVKLDWDSRKSVDHRVPIHYMRNSRGMTDDEIARAIKIMDMRYCPTGEYANRLVFPVWQHGRIVYFTTRHCGKHPVKAKNPPNVDGFYHRDNCLLGYDRCVGKKVVALAEGAFSVAAFPHAVGTMGKYCSPEQFELVCSLAAQGTEELVIGLDADATLKAAELRRKFAGRFREVTMLTFDHGDPDDRRKELRSLLERRGVPRLGELVRATFVSRK